ncbi:MAG: hypothetical protein QMB65_03710 [Vicingaceae bacterium]|jgi:hypothetical protein
MLKRLFSTLKIYIFNKSFLLGSCLTIGIFAQYIFGPDNLAEQLEESLFENTTGHKVDFSPELKKIED